MGRPAKFLVATLILAAVFSFWQLGRHDVVSDEASYMARGMRMLDFNFGIEQPTPIQWVDEVPFWMNLSFHDHPPLVFFVEYVSFYVFGDGVIPGRIPAVVAGLLAAFFVFLIGKELYSRNVGLIGAALFSFTVGHVWVSRIALQESMVIALMLGASYAFLRAFNEKRMLIRAGALTGLAILAKYTAIILLPIFLTILLLKRRDYFLSREFLFAALVLLLAASPVIIYNIGLYQTFGHFDFQLSYVFGQDVSAWSEMPGKEEVGSLGDRFKNYLPNLLEINSPLFLLLSLAGLILMFQRIKPHAVFFSFLLWFAAFMLVIGPSHRFLSMLTPWLAIAGAVFAVFAWDLFVYKTSWFVGKVERIFFSKRAIAAALVVMLVGWEAAYAYNSVIALTPRGPSPWTYADIRSEGNNWGYNQLEDFMTLELYGKRPAPAVSFNYPVISRLLNRVVERDTEAGLEPVPWMLIYNGNMSLAVQLWTFLRRIVYNGWPTTDAETYKRILAENGEDHFERMGIEKAYFINNTAQVILREVRNRPLSADGDLLEAELREQGIIPEEIKNLRGETAFQVYEFVP